MSRRARRTHSPAFKAKVALTAVRGDKTLAEWRSSSICNSTRSPAGSSSCSVGDRRATDGRPAAPVKEWPPLPAGRAGAYG